MPSSPRVAIIVLNYNGKDCLPVCLASLDKLEYPNKEIIVIDNASSDDSFVVAEKTFPECIFVRNTKNEGFAKGMNTGIRLAFTRGAQWCWLVNYDTEVDKAALTALIAVTQKYPQAGLLSPMIYPVRERHAVLRQGVPPYIGTKFVTQGFSNGVFEKESADPWFAKGRIDFFRMCTRHSNPTKRELASDAYPSEFLTGCALLIKKELADTVGLLDERFFLYYEDADYSMRARRAGFFCLVVPGALVWHSEESRTRPEKTYFLVYSGLLFFEKYASFFMRPYFLVYVTIRRVKNWLDRARRRNNADVAVHQAYEYFFHEH